MRHSFKWGIGVNLNKEDSYYAQNTKKRSSDREHSQEFVVSMFAFGRGICPSVSKAIRMLSRDKVTLPVNDDMCTEISLALLGASLAILKGHSQVMTRDRGIQIFNYCKQAICENYNLPVEKAGELINTLDEYQEAFQKSMSNNNNPFGEISGVMLVRCLGKQIMEFCMPGTSDLNPLVHQIIGDILTLTITKGLTFWEGK